MKILFLTPVFAPSVGGIEKVAEQVAAGLVGRGHQVRVATETEGDGADVFPFSVHRCPNGRELRQLFRWADVVWHHQLCLRMLMRSGVFPRRMGATFHTWLPARGLGATVRRSIISRFGARFGVSQAIAAHVPKPNGVLPNSFDPAIFRLPENQQQTQRRIGCVGRLVSDKGIDLLIDALGLLGKQGFESECAIVGEGPEREALEGRVRKLGLSDQVSFHGPMKPGKLATFYRSCAVCVVPSRWQEPFGLVALEAIACGTPVIAANHGGLPEAAGYCGLFFQPGNEADLARRLEDFFADGETLRERLLEGRENHLAQFHPDAQLDAYEAAFKALLS